MAFSSLPLSSLLMRVMSARSCMRHVSTHMHMRKPSGEGLLHCSAEAVPMHAMRPPITPYTHKLVCVSALCAMHAHVAEM
jgi:hypothetical protein